MRLRVTIIVGISSLILIGCAAFPRHPDRQPTIWEVITAYTNPDSADNHPNSAGTVEDRVASLDEEPTATLLPGTRVAVAQTRVHETKLAMTATVPTATLLPGTRVAVAQTRVHETKLAMTAAVPIATLLPGTRVAVAQTRVHTTKVAMTAAAAVTGTAVITETSAPRSGTRVAAVPTKGSGSDDDSEAGTTPTATRARPTATARNSTPESSTPRPTATKRPEATPTRTPAPTKGPTKEATPTRRVEPTPDKPPTSPPSPPEDPIREDVYIRSHVGTSQSGEYVVVGEIINGEDYPIYGARVVGTFYDDDGNLIGAQEEMAIFPKTHTEQPNPFRLAASDPAGQVESYELTLVWEDISVVDFAPVSVQGTEVDDEDKLEISGELVNEQSTEVTSIIVTITFYDEEGGVVAAYDEFYGAQTLSPGGTMPYTLSIPDSTLEYDTFYVQAQGNLNLY